MNVEGMSPALAVLDLQIAINRRAALRRLKPVHILLISQQLPSMHTINVQAVTLPLFLEQYPALTPPADFLETVERTGQSLVFEGCISVQVREQSPLEPERVSAGHDLQLLPALLFAMASVEPGTLLNLARAMPEEYNENSADLKTSTTYLGWKADGLEVRLNTWHLRSFPGNMGTRRFVVALVSGEHAVIADHTLDADGMDCLMSGLQGAQGSSGPNYQPWRIWSEDTVMAQKGATEVLKHGVHTSDVVRRSEFAGS